MSEENGDQCKQLVGPPSSEKSSPPANFTDLAGRVKTYCRENKKGLLIIGAIAVPMMLMMLMGICLYGGVILLMIRDNTKANAQIDEADRLWTAGMKSEALSIYRELVADPFPSGRAYSNATIYQRVIESDIENGNISAAKDLIRRVRKGDRCSLAFTNPKAQELLKQVEAELGSKPKRDPDDEASNPQNGGRKLAAFRKIVDHIKKLPDPTDGRSKRDEWYKRAEGLLREFEAIPFSATADRAAGKKIVELYKKEIDGRYTGFFAMELEAVIERIVADLINS
jgi:hypothetical protein